MEKLKCSICTGFLDLHSSPYKKSFNLILCSKKCAVEAGVESVKINAIVRKKRIGAQRRWPVLKKAVL